MLHGGCKLRLEEELLLGFAIGGFGALDRLLTLVDQRLLAGGVLHQHYLLLVIFEAVRMMMVLQLLLQLKLLVHSVGAGLHLTLLKSHPVNARDVGKTVERWVMISCSSGTLLLTWHALDAATVQEELVLKCFGHSERTAD